MKQGKEIDKFGTECWYKEGKFHREDGPALIPKEGSKSYYLNDKEEYLKVLNCPLEELPLYINTELAPVARRRLNHDTNN